jgi:DNA invertase Pin-like site-specific DNA recombinase
MESKSTNDLLELFKSFTGKNEPEVDITNYRYVIYARKSTEDETRQVRSIPDQLKDCVDIARLRNLKVIGNPIVETKSAKEANLRPKFAQMIQDIQEGKYEGIIAWHPDRLSRNMREAGS